MNNSPHDIDVAQVEAGQLPIPPLEDTDAEPPLPVQDNAPQIQEVFEPEPVPEEISDAESDVEIVEVVNLLSPPPPVPAFDHQAWLLQQQMILDAQAAEDAQVAADAQLAAELQGILDQDDNDSEADPEDDDEDGLEDDDNQIPPEALHQIPPEVLQQLNRILGVLVAFVLAFLALCLALYWNNISVCRAVYLVPVFVTVCCLWNRFHRKHVIAFWMICLAFYWRGFTPAYAVPTIFILDFLWDWLYPIFCRYLPGRRFVLWMQTQNHQRVQQLRLHYDENRNLIDQTDCPVCMDISDRSTIFFPCLHQMCFECSTDQHFQGIAAQCPTCRCIIEERVEVEGRPFTAPFQVFGQVKGWVINWGSGEEVPAAN